jgi:hypothetical protein
VQDRAIVLDKQQLRTANQRHCLRVLFGRLPYSLAGLLIAGFFFAGSTSRASEASGQAQIANGAPSQKAGATLIVFHDEPVPKGLLPAIAEALQEELAAGSADLRRLLEKENGPTDESGAVHPIKILSKEEIVLGMIVENPLPVYLHGECKILPRAAHDLFQGITVSGALGWVISDRGHIESFIHVDCGRLADMLSTAAFGRNREQRDRLLALAISKVVLHEWIHIATQNPHHSKRGIEQAAFNVKDLIANPAPEPIQLGPHTGKRAGY